MTQYHATMQLPVVIRTRCTNLVGPDGTTERWTAEALLYGRPLESLYESEGTATEAAAVRKVKERIRAASRRAQERVR